MGASDFVVEKTGKIEQDYTIINPPLGKGAFGEVRKGIHKKTKEERAIKFIDKILCPKDELEKLFNEVHVLK